MLVCDDLVESLDEMATLRAEIQERQANAAEDWADGELANDEIKALKEVLLGVETCENKIVGL